VSPVIGTVLTGILILVGAGIVGVLAKGVLTVRDNTSAIEAMTKAFDDHIDEAHQYRKGVEHRLRQLEKQVTRRR